MMRIQDRAKKRIVNVLTHVYTSHPFQDTQRFAYTANRRLFFRKPIVRYFHQVDDPYSCIAIQTLAKLQDRYDVTFEIYLVPSPGDLAVPRREMLRLYSLRDAALLAKNHALKFSMHNEDKLDSDDILLANSIIVAANKNTFGIEAASRVTQALWSHDKTLLKSLAEQYGVAIAHEVSNELSKNHAIRKSYGHYLSATFYFEGEWYWGIDRLPYLESRLIDAGFSKIKSNKVPEYSFKDMLLPFKYSSSREFKQEPSHSSASSSKKPEIDLWYSFRSPYVWISLPRIRALAKHYDAQLNLHYVMPMIMRDLPVPMLKEMYIVRDVKREADRCGIPFGCIIDPAGSATERAMALQYYAIQLGCGEEFAESAFKGIFADGIDLSTDEGLLLVAERVGLNKAIVDIALTDDRWRTVAAENLKQLYEIGLWGEPTFRVNGGPAFWGQDRLLKLEEDLRCALKLEKGPTQQVSVNLRSKL